METLGARQDVRGAEYRADETVAALKAIAKHLSGIPGRKNLVWVSASLQSQTGGRAGIRSFQEEIVTAIRTLADAIIAVYPVDARGLVGPNMQIGLRGSLAHQKKKKKKSRREEFDTMLNFAEGNWGTSSLQC